MSTITLERETTPPEGQLACPKPQYANEVSGEYEALTGSGGAANARITDFARRHLTTALIGGSVSVGTTATAIPAVATAGRWGLRIWNPTNVNVWICKSDNTKIGIIWPNSDELFLLKDETILIYLLVDSGTQTIYYQEMK